jgi:pathogenesis-related protein 1
MSRWSALLASTWVLVACNSSSGDAGSGGSGGGSSEEAANGSGAGDAGTGAGEPAGMEGMTEHHNIARASVDPPASPPMPPLVWDDQIAAVAQAYSEQCIWGHSDGEYGENLYASAGLPSTPKDVVEGWVSEVEFYDYASNECQPDEMCGHYTQVVWADSLRVGCGFTACTTGSPFSGFSEWQNWVCNYDPPGNWVGEKPY